MVDVTLQIMLEPATHDLSYNPEKAAARFRRGDIFAGHLAPDVATLTSGTYNITEGIGSTVFGYVHITGVPTNLAVKARNVLIFGTSETAIEVKPDPVTGLDEEHVSLDDWRLRRWRIPRSALTPGSLNKLLADREITITWAKVKPRIRKKIIAVRLDPLQDDETTELTDADVT